MILISQWSGSYYVPLVYRWPIYPECQGARHLPVLDLNTALILRSFSLTKLQTRHHSQEWARIWSILETTNLYYTSMIETEEQYVNSTQLHFLGEGHTAEGGNGTLRWDELDVEVFLHVKTKIKFFEAFISELRLIFYFS